jgi:hypothetical protein
MDKKTPRRLPIYMVVAFILCSCNLLLREFVVDLDNCIDRDFPHPIAEHGGVPDPTHIEDHDDDFVWANMVTPNIRIGIVHDIGITDLSTFVRVLSPLLPPPKAA